MSKITTRQIAEIARQTKACHPEGLGIVINVFADGDCMQGISESDVIARGDGNGGWDHRITCLRHPMTRAEVTEHIAYVLADIAQQQAEWLAMQAGAEEIEYPSAAQMEAEESTYQAKMLANLEADDARHDRTAA